MQHQAAATSPLCIHGVRGLYAGAVGYKAVTLSETRWREGGGREREAEPLPCLISVGVEASRGSGVPQWQPHAFEATYIVI